MLSVVIPGDIIVKIISITDDGIVNFFVRDICAVVDTELRTGKLILVAEDSYPVKSLDMFTTLAEMLVGFGEDVDRKLEQAIV
jgi:hypothetical protein